jgi:predicted phage terminase large subunit-like protein
MKNWHVINLPAIAEEDDDILGRHIGDALWPERYPIEDLENIRETIGTEAFNSLYQQRPAAEGGDMVKLEWFDRFDLKDPPAFRKFVLSADTAQKETELHDPTAVTVWGETDTDYYLIDCYNKRWNYPRLKKNIVRIWEKYNNQHPSTVPLLIEDKGSGTSLIQDLKLETRIPVIATKAVKSKEIRMSDVTALMESGRVFLPKKAHWLYEVETQLSRFPHWKHDDICDSISHYLKWAGRPRYKKSRLIYYK